MRHRLFLAAFAVYTVAVSGWLLLGLASTLAAQYPALHAEAVALSRSTGWPTPLRALARGVVAPSEAVDEHAARAILDYLFSAVSLGLGVLLVHLGGRQVVVRLLAVGLVGSAGAFNLSTHRALGAAEAATGYDLDIAHVFLLHVLAGVCYVYALLLFPGGRFAPRGRFLHGWIRVPASIMRAVAGNVALLFLTLMTGTAHPSAFVVFYGVLAPLVGIVAQRRRLRSARSAEERQQSRVLLRALVFAVAAAVGLAVLTVLLTAVRLPGFAPTSPEAVIFGVFRALSLVVPLAVIVGVMRYRLWDIDRLFSRAMRYGILAVFVTVAYTAVVLGVSAVLGSRARAGAAVPLLATCLVAIAFQPIRERVRLAADRLVYGPRSSPELLMSELIRRVSAMPPDDELLTRVAEGVGLGMRATHCRVAVLHPAGEDARCWPDGAAPPPTGWDVTVPVVHLGEDIGAISVRTAAGERIDAQQRRILADIADQAGPALATLRRSADLRRRLDETTALAAQLQASCREIMATAARERGRLERDIHDGAQQQLLALRLALGALRDDTGDAAQALGHRLSQAHVSLLALVRESCPPVLARAGLAVAVREAAETSATSPSVRAIGVEGVRFPRQVETAAYFCCLEALNNCARHASGAAVQVDLRLDDGAVVVEVRDAGAGFDPARQHAGTGLAGMAERLAALGGQLDVSSTAGVGTVVTARLPLSSRLAQPAS